MTVPMQTGRKKKSKQKSDVFKKTMTNYDVSSRRVGAIASFEAFVRNQLIFRAVFMCFVLSRKVFAIFLIG